MTGLAPLSEGSQTQKSLISGLLLVLLPSVGYADSSPPRGEPDPLPH